MLMAEFLLLVLCWRIIRANNARIDYFLFCSIVFLALYMIAPYIFYGKRVAAYFSFANIITLGATIHAFHKKTNKLIVSAAIIGMAFLYWLYFYYFKNGSETMPYILGI
jgi:hypothetical protein